MTFEQGFSGLIEKCVEELQAKFKDGLEEKCRIGAANVRSDCHCIID